MNANKGWVSDDRRGFVLVGVAMFILVLTILGLSLFTLSGFESQFTVKSLHRSAAFSAASGGIERARFALLSTDKLESVKDFLPRDGVIYARAIQGPDPDSGDSTGTIDPNGEDIWVRVRAQQDGATVEVQARFEAEQPQDYYKRLITARHVFVSSAEKPQTYISGAVAQPLIGNTSWNTPPPPSDPPGRPPIEVRNTLQLPALVSYYDAHRPGASQALNPGLSGNYTLNAGGGTSYFYSPPDVGGQWNVLATHPNPSISVNGTAIWLLKAGTVACMQFTDRVTITGTPGSRLIIVARPVFDQEEQRAVEFNGGIMDGTPGIPATGIPLIIVTPGLKVSRPSASM